MFLCRALIWPSVLLFTTLTCCKIAGYSSPLEPWKQVYADWEKIYRPDEAETAKSSDESELMAQPSAQNQTPLVTVPSEDFNTPALDAVLQGMGKTGGNI